jgi:hypothetical protein
MTWHDVVRRTFCCKSFKPACHRARKGASVRTSSWSFKVGPVVSSSSHRGGWRDVRTGVFCFSEADIEASVCQRTHKKAALDVIKDIHDALNHTIPPCRLSIINHTSSTGSIPDSHRPHALKPSNCNYAERITLVNVWPGL